MGLRRIEYRGLRPLKIGLSLPPGIYQVPETVAAQIKRAAPMSVDDVDGETPADDGLSGLTLTALQKAAQKAQIPGRSKMDRDQLEAALSASEETEG